MHRRAVSIFDVFSGLSYDSSGVLHVENSFDAELSVLSFSLPTSRPHLLSLSPTLRTESLLSLKVLFFLGPIPIVLFFTPFTILPVTFFAGPNKLTKAVK